MRLPLTTLSLLAALHLACLAQAPATSSSSASGQGIVLDRVVAVVNGDLILESDVDEERRLQAFQPFTHPDDKFSREDAVHRLIDRDLILQQARMQPGNEVSDAEVQAELNTLRKEIPACHEFHCETEAGWDKFIAAQGFTPQQLATRWKERMEVLKFIELRFRMGIRIPPADIKAYYEKTMLPEYARLKSPAPALDVVSPRIQEVLLERQVSSLLDEWLKSLRAQGSVRIIQPGEATP